VAPDEERPLPRPPLREEPNGTAPGDLLPTEEEEEQDKLAEEGFAALLADRRRLLIGTAVVVLIVAAIYLLLPNVAGLEDVFQMLDDGTWYWFGVAVLANVGAFAAYVALFRGILGGRRDDEVHRRLDIAASYQITMAGLAATRIFSAAGAGGLIVTYWAVRKAGMPRRRAACRMVAFLALLYVFYLAALVLFGVLLRTGVLPGDNPVGGTIVPAGIAAGVLLVIALMALIPHDFERRIAALQGRPRFARIGSRLAAYPATVATGIRTALDYIRHPKIGALAVVGAIGFWAFNIAILAASFEAFQADVPFGVLVQGFFLGMTANLLPSPAGGVGSVDAGMIGAFLLFGIPSAEVFAAVLVYRVIAFWLPIPPGIVAYFQLRGTVAEWEAERQRAGTEAAVR
jgi:uncharacterized protein (TIRG00374 family)